MTHVFDDTNKPRPLGKAGETVQEAAAPPEFTNEKVEVNPTAAVLAPRSAILGGLALIVICTVAGS